MRALKRTSFAIIIIIRGRIVHLWTIPNNIIMSLSKCFAWYPRWVVKRHQTRQRAVALKCQLWTSKRSRVNSKSTMQITYWDKPPLFGVRHHLSIHRRISVMRPWIWMISWNRTSPWSMSGKGSARKHHWSYHLSTPKMKMTIDNSNSMMNKNHNSSCQTLSKKRRYNLTWTWKGKVIEMNS